MKRGIWIIALALCSGIACGDVAQPADQREMCHRATCRVRVDTGNESSLGSGTFIKATDTHLYVLTNAHVTGQRLGTRAKLEMWYQGHQSNLIDAEVVAVGFVPNGYRDLAVVRVDRQRLGGYLPPIIPIAPEHYQPSYTHIYTVGCAGGRWPTALDGFGVDLERKPGSILKFKPAPAGGRSGSGIFDLSQGRPMLIGLLTWRNSNEPHNTDGRGEASGYGLAQTHWEILAGLRGDRPSTFIDISSALGPALVPCQMTRRNVMRPPQEPPAPQTPQAQTPQQAPTATVHDEHKPVKPSIPETSNRPGDVVLLVSDPVAVGPDLEPAQTAGIDGNCPNGQCPNPYQQPQQRGNDNRLFPSLPYLDDQPQQAPTPAPNVPQSATPKAWIPWVALGVVLFVQFGALVKKFFESQLAAAVASAKKANGG